MSAQAAPPQTVPTIKLVLVGDGGTGKVRDAYPLVEEKTLQDLQHHNIRRLR